MAPNGPLPPSPPRNEDPSTPMPVIKTEPGVLLNSLPSPPESATSENSFQPIARDQQPAAKHPPSGTGPYLEDLSRSILDVTLNQKDVSHPLLVKHLSASFRSKHDALPRATNRTDHHNNLSSHLATQPEFHVEIMNASSEVDDSRGRATVYLWYGISGLDRGLMREAVAVLSWERRQGLWQIVKHTGMRGPSGFW